MRISLIVTTYNRPQALDRVLESLAAQETMPHEVIVADDGSGQETAAVVAGWQARFPVPLRHVWHQDLGFRAAEVRNMAVASSSADYLIFLDGDCLVFGDFVARHRTLAESGRMVVGNRMLLSEALTDTTLAGDIRPLNWSWSQWRAAQVRGEVNRVLPLLLLPGQAWRRLRPRRWRGVHTCNLGLWRDDFAAANGFDEHYQGWGHEDADLAIRLMRYGVLRKDGQFAVPVLHLWHRENDRGAEAENRARLEDVINGNRPIRAEIGLDRCSKVGRKSGISRLPPDVGHSADNASKTPPAHPPYAG